MGEAPGWQTMSQGPRKAVPLAFAISTEIIMMGTIGRTPRQQAGNARAAPRSLSHLRQRGRMHPAGAVPADQRPSKEVAVSR